MNDASAGRAPAHDRTHDALPDGASWRPERCDRIALIFQGGGALGAYQAGVYEALHEAGIEPDWVTGVSIGAINAAIIAGNPRERRIERLRAFWERITERRIWAHTPDGDIYRRARNATSAMMTMSQGQPGFFKPHPVNAWFSPAGAATATSFYDTAPLRETLLELVDFDMINEQRSRFSVGAVNVVNGNFIYFDNANQTIGPEHIMASGALPPALPMVKIGTDYFWDGGIVSNTPLQHLLDQEDGMNSLVFQVDLFSARGHNPTNIDEAENRAKDIRYSSRTRAVTNNFRRQHDLGHNIQLLWERLPEDLRKLPEAQYLYHASCVTVMDIVQLVYRPTDAQGTSKGYEFGRPTMRARWAAGVADAAATLAAAPWLAPARRQLGVRSFDVGFYKNAPRG